MHLPDGFIQNETAAGLSGAMAVFAVAAGLAARREFLKGWARVRNSGMVTAEGIEISSPRLKFNKLARERIWAVVWVSCFVFAAQMFNYPVGDGVSGHFIGAFLAALVLGPWMGFLVMMGVLVVQSLVFADGGVLALGANILNMGIVGGILAYYLFAWLWRWLKYRYKFALIFAIAWLAVVMAAGVCVAETIFSGKGGSEFFEKMMSVHVLIGLGEATITIGVLWLMRQEKMFGLERIRRQGGA